MKKVNKKSGLLMLLIYMSTNQFGMISTLPTPQSHTAPARPSKGGVFSPKIYSSENTKVKKNSRNRDNSLLHYDAKLQFDIHS